MSIESRRTPYDDEYETCLETRAKLLIYPGELHPDEITRRLGLVPTEANVAGKVRVNRLGREHVVKISGWFLSSEGHVESKELRRHLDWLLALLRPARAALLELQSMRGVTMGIDCVWTSRSGHGGPTLWPEQMHEMAALGLECSFDVYFFGDDQQ